MDDTEKTPIIRRQVFDELSIGSFTTQALVHMVHYDASVQHYHDEALVRLHRPIDVANIGAGDMWDLRVIIHGRKWKKSSILGSYHAFDIIERESPFGKKLSDEIAFEYVSKNMNDDPTVDLQDDSMDMVVSTEFIEHICKNSAKKILREMHRILRDGGLCYITTPNADNSSRSDKYHIYEWPLDELLDELDSIRFTDMQCHGTYIDTLVFKKANAEHKVFSDEAISDLESRFSSAYLRLFLATPYPAYANGIVITCRK